MRKWQGTVSEIVLFCRGANRECGSSIESRNSCDSEPDQWCEHVSLASEPLPREGDCQSVRADGARERRVQPNSWHPDIRTATQVHQRLRQRLRPIIEPCVLTQVSGASKTRPTSLQISSQFDEIVSTFLAHLALVDCASCDQCGDASLFLRLDTWSV